MLKSFLRLYKVELTEKVEYVLIDEEDTRISSAFYDLSDAFFNDETFKISRLSESITLQFLYEYLERDDTFYFISEETQIKKYTVRKILSLYDC